MNKAARTLAAGVAVAALALTGCANAPADAATVNGVRIADSTVREVAQILGSTPGADSTMVMKQATFDLLMGEASRQIAASTGTTIKASDQSGLMAQYPAVGAVAQNPQGKPWVDAVTASYLVHEQLGAEKFLEELNKVDITVNPRYGQWATNAGGFVDGSLSRMADPTTLRR